MEENAAYGLSAEDQLQVTTETNLTFGLRSEHELQENPVEQVTDSAHHFNSVTLNNLHCQSTNLNCVMCLED